MDLYRLQIVAMLVYLKPYLFANFKFMYTSEGHDLDSPVTDQMDSSLYLSRQIPTQLTDTIHESSVGYKLLLMAMSLDLLKADVDQSSYCDCHPSLFNWFSQSDASDDCPNCLNPNPWPLTNISTLTTMS